MLVDYLIWPYFSRDHKSFTRDEIIKKHFQKLSKKFWKEKLLSTLKYKFFIVKFC